MSTKATERAALLQGTLDLLILRTLLHGKQHGHGIARAIQESSHDVLLVDHGSLYPALQRLEGDALITASWGVSDNGRRARFYVLTARGKKQLQTEADRWHLLASAISRVLGPSFARG